MTSPVNSIQYSRILFNIQELAPILLKFLQEIWEERILPHWVYEASLTLKPKPDSTGKENHRQYSSWILMRRYLQAEFNITFKRLCTMMKLDLLLQQKGISPRMVQQTETNHINRIATTTKPPCSSPLIQKSTWETEHPFRIKTLNSQVPWWLSHKEPD